MRRKNFYLIDSVLDVDGAKGYVVYPDYPVSDKEKDKEFYKNLAVLPEQTHSLNVGIVEDAGSEFKDTDALITFTHNLPIGIVTADCVPILLYAPDAQGVAAVHAGWRGTLGGILNSVLDILIGRGAHPENICAWFGPSICMVNYEVDGELAQKFIDAGFSDHVYDYDSTNSGKRHIDLQDVNCQILLQRGLKSANIHLSSFCTCGQVRDLDRHIYQSYRRDGEKAGRILTFIRLEGFVEL